MICIMSSAQFADARSDSARLSPTVTVAPSGILTPWTKPFENVRTSTYRVRTGTCQYENLEIVCTWYVRVQDVRTGMY
jgi:hypothetical protein